MFRIKGVLKNMKAATGTVLEKGVLKNNSSESCQVKLSGKILEKNFYEENISATLLNLNSVTVFFNDFDCEF